MAKPKTIVFFSSVAVTTVLVTLLMNSTTPRTNKTRRTSTPQDTSVDMSWPGDMSRPGDPGPSPGRDAPPLADRASKSKPGYVLANHYAGQQGAGVRSLGLLQCLVGSYKLPVKILEPFAVGSLLSSDFSPNFTSAPLKFRDLFDLQHFNNLSQQEAEPTLASWNDFVENAPRNVINIYIYKGNKLEFQLLGDVRSGVGIGKLDMDTTKEQLCFSTKYTENEQLNKLGVCVVRIARLTLLAKKVVADDNVYKYLYGDWDPRRTTLVFDKWKCSAWVQNPTSLGDFNCSDPKRDRIKHRLLPSQRLLKDSQSYTKQYLQSSNEVAIMVRSEHVLLDHKGETVTDGLNYLSSCLRSAIGKAHERTQADSSIYLTLDVSTYGSKTTPSSLGTELLNKTYEVLQDVITDLYSNQKLSLRDWEDRFIKASGRTDNPAYIAALQRTIASQSNCLILVGGGNFQALARNEYLRLHPNPGEQCVHTVCLWPNHK